MIKFEKVSRFENEDIPMPIRKTEQSAGYDFVVAEDIIIPSYLSLLTKIIPECTVSKVYNLSEMKEITKRTKAKPTLVSTGMKCKLEPDTYLELMVRSSTPSKYWIMMANSIGIIDADYYNNPENEGEIYFQLINLSPAPIVLHKGDIIGQGIIKKYLKINEDISEGKRVGGFGSTGEKNV